MVMGRPREWDREKLKWQLMHWAELPNSLNINAFCCLPDILISPTKLLQFVKEDQDFREVYNIVKAFIAARREEANCEKILSDKAFAISHKVYDLFQKEEDREDFKYQKELERDIQKEIKNEGSDEIVARFEGFLDHFDSLSKRRKADSQSISDK